MRRYCPARAEEEDVQGDGDEPEDVLEEEEPEDLDEIMGEVNEWDQTLYGAGRGGATEEEEQQALQLQQHVARQLETWLNFYKEKERTSSLCIFDYLRNRC